ncbi:putative secreted protein [Corynebacterium deserti GIMN1.010]|uniref:Putative secreted protein n=1 Tax=Corynebacterium deserti GIMN1.010 TaxID=931089 RepID=A0A0M4CFS6_9CORY|nr:hypothetical protein [Corynebacterium deserti]ALC05690.1 putative secreted protein [Corynebacterium deserti GIMN1.010]
MRTTSKIALTISTIGVLTLSACSTSSDTQATSDTPVVSQTTETVLASETETVQETVEVTEDPSTQATSSSSEPDDAIPNDLLPRTGIDVGAPISIGAEQATVCIYGDGYGTNVWAAGENTSCEFVSEVHNELIDGLNPTTDNIRDNLPQSVTANSPTTGQEYELTCTPRGDVLVTCRGGDNASVHFY